MGKGLSGSWIARAWAFITDFDDVQNTPAEFFFEMARAAGAEVRVHDPGVDPETSLGLSPRRCARPAIVDGLNVIDPDAWIAGGSCLGDRNRHALRE